MARAFEDHCWRDIVSEETLRVYEPYQREVFVGDRPALLAIDLYNLAYRGGAKEPHELVKEHPSSCGRYAWEAIANTEMLFSAARAAKLPIIYTTAPHSSAVVATNRQVGSGSDEDDFQIYKAFKPREDDLVIVKERASGFYGTPLLVELNRLGVKSLVVCGESTSGCVRASVVAAYSAGYHVCIAEESVYDRSILSHKVSLFDLHHKYADVLNVSDVLAHLKQL